MGGVVKPIVPMSADRHELVEQYLPVAFKLSYDAWRKRYRTGELDDFRQEAMFALSKAARDWDEARGVKFITLAYVYIRRQLFNIEDSTTPTHAMPDWESDLIDTRDNPCDTVDVDDEYCTMMRNALSPTEYAVVRETVIHGRTLRSVASEIPGLRGGCSYEAIRKIKEKSLTKLYHYCKRRGIVP